MGNTESLELEFGHMKHLFLVMMVGVLVGCGKKEKEEPQVQTETLKFPGNLIWKFEAGIMSSSPTIGSDGTVYIRSTAGSHSRLRNRADLSAPHGIHQGATAAAVVNDLPLPARAALGHFRA